MGSERMTKLDISIVTYNDGKFDVIFCDSDSGEEITFSGEQKIGSDDFDFINRIAPACVFTKYRRVTPEDTP